MKLIEWGSHRFYYNYGYHYDYDYYYYGKSILRGNHLTGMPRVNVSYDIT